MRTWWLGCCKQKLRFGGNISHAMKSCLQAAGNGDLIHLKATQLLKCTFSFAPSVGTWQVLRAQVLSMLRTRHHTERGSVAFGLFSTSPTCFPFRNPAIASKVPSESWRELIERQLLSDAMRQQTVVRHLRLHNRLSWASHDFPGLSTRG